MWQLFRQVARIGKIESQKWQICDVLLLHLLPESVKLRHKCGNFVTRLHLLPESIKLREPNVANLWLLHCQIWWIGWAKCGKFDSYILCQNWENWVSQMWQLLTRLRLLPELVKLRAKSGKFEINVSCSDPWYMPYLAIMGTDIILILTTFGQNGAYQKLPKTAIKHTCLQVALTIEKK